MRIWHWKILPYLPNLQLVAQWRELNSIFKKQDKHILINYVYEYPKDDLYFYSLLVIGEMIKRGLSIHHLENMQHYFNLNDEIMYLGIPNADKFKLETIIFKNHHNQRYLNQCFYNLQEKYDRGQKDFDYDTYWKLERFMVGEKLL